MNKFGLSPFACARVCGAVLAHETAFCYQIDLRRPTDWILSYLEPLTARLRRSQLLLESAALLLLLLATVEAGWLSQSAFRPPGLHHTLLLHAEHISFLLPPSIPLVKLADPFMAYLVDRRRAKHLHEPAFPHRRRLPDVFLC